MILVHMMQLPTEHEVIAYRQAVSDSNAKNVYNLNSLKLKNFNWFRYFLFSFAVNKNNFVSFCQSSLSRRRASVARRDRLGEEPIASMRWKCCQKGGRLRRRTYTGLDHCFVCQDSWAGPEWLFRRENVWQMVILTSRPGARFSKLLKKILRKWPNLRRS